MICKTTKSCLLVAVLLISLPALSQLQNCPANINFSSGDLSFWSARTGLINNTAPQIYPAPNAGVSTITEYTISATGIHVITSNSADPYGSFPTIPNINGYSYGYSVKIGSSATSYDLHSTSSNPGGFTRAISYIINVPAGPTTVPYTMTYAYAMVLENGTHNSNEQPLFKATVSTVDSVITCASPQYYLPTFNNAGGGAGGSGSTGATLDTAAALANGFKLSPIPFLSHAGQAGTGTLLQDVWTKGWTEVTFDLSLYRGRQVTLTFEADNCAPGAHFAYAYVALRNTCAGLQISGPQVACSGSNFVYSVPALTGGSYNWSVPAGWSINSGSGTNIINVTPGIAGGNVIVNEINGCANLKDTLTVATTPPTVPGQVLSNTTVCSGTNSTLLNLNGQTGNVINWIYSTNGGTSWTALNNTNTSYNAQNLTTTTQYRALVQNSGGCKLDTSAAAIVSVDPKSVGGVIDPANSSFCLGQNMNSILTLTGQAGTVVNWQRSPDQTNWTGFVPTNNSSTYNVTALNATTYYRTIVKSGVCPADTSAVATINFINVPFPQAAINPKNDSICFNKTATLNANITIGTDYSWSNTATLSGQGNGNITSLPQTLTAIAGPKVPTNYVLTVHNAGCPNAFTDTFHIWVAPKITVFAGNDTNIVANQPLQFNATASDPTATNFNWSPSTGLSSTTIYNPIAMLGPEIDYITYVVRATNSAGCYGEDDVKVAVFKTGPDIFVPSAFTPNSDGHNDYIYPVCVGIKQLNFFKIFNRWGQLVFSTSQVGKGWDGTINGTPQATNNYVYMVQGVDYTGRVIFKKGNIVLIR